MLAIIRQLKQFLYILVPVQYFDYSGKGINSKIFDIQTVPNEIAETLEILITISIKNII